MKNWFPEFCSQAATVYEALRKHHLGFQQKKNNWDRLLQFSLIILKCEYEQKTQPQCSIVQKVH